MGVRLEGGRFALDPFTVEVPGGSVAMTASLAPTAQHTDAAFTLLMERFDFGILARRVDPETEMGGLARLDVALQTSGPSARALMANADGHLDFAIFPHDFEAGIIDLWAVNLLAAAVSAVDDEGEEGERSKLNCVVGIFDLEDGLMRALRLLLDTSRMSVEGHAEVNFDTNEVYVELAPASKRAEFFSLATPVEIEGTIPDFEIGVDAGALVGTVIRFVTSVVYVPVQRLLADEPPRDELENCLGALELRDEKKSVLGIF